MSLVENEVVKAELVGSPFHIHDSKNDSEVDGGGQTAVN